jgi:hypothetical protein
MLLWSPIYNPCCGESRNIKLKNNGRPLAQPPKGAILTSMTTPEVATKFVEMCRQGKNFDVMQQMYDEDIVSVEAVRRKTGSFETAGKSAVIQKSAEWAGAHEIHGGSVEGPFLLDNRFAVTFEFEVTPKATGQRVKVREVGVYTVADGLITREEFFYADGADALAR